MNHPTNLEHIVANPGPLQSPDASHLAERILRTAPSHAECANDKRSAPLPFGRPIPAEFI